MARKTIIICDDCGADITPEQKKFSPHIYNGDGLGKTITLPSGYRVSYQISIGKGDAKSDLCALCGLKAVSYSIPDLDKLVNDKIKQFEAVRDHG